MTLEVYDKDTGDEDQFLGSAVVPLAELTQDLAEHDVWRQLQGVKKQGPWRGGDGGMVRVACSGSNAQVQLCRCFHDF